MILCTILILPYDLIAMMLSSIFQRDIKVTDVLFVGLLIFILPIKAVAALIISTLIMGLSNWILSDDFIRYFQYKNNLPYGMNVEISSEQKVKRGYKKTQLLIFSITFTASYVIRDALLEIKISNRSMYEYLLNFFKGYFNLWSPRRSLQNQNDFIINSSAKVMILTSIMLPVLLLVKFAVEKGYKIIPRYIPFMGDVITDKLRFEEETFCEYINSLPNEKKQRLEYLIFKIKCMSEYPELSKGSVYVLRDEDNIPKELFLNKAIKDTVKVKFKDLKKEIDRYDKSL